MGFIQVNHQGGNTLRRHIDEEMTPVERDTVGCICKILVFRSTIGSDATYILGEMVKVDIMGVRLPLIENYYHQRVAMGVEGSQRLPTIGGDDGITWLDET